MKYKEIDGDLIVLAKQGVFDVIAHGCNCFCVMGAGLAPQMAKAFGADRFHMENESFRGDINKLGTIDYAYTYLKGTTSKIEYKTPYSYTVPKTNSLLEEDGWHKLVVVNCYSQYDMTGRRVGKIDLDYKALALCFQKMNHIFKGKHIGLPQIGCHLGGGDWKVVRSMIQEYFTDCNVTVVHYKPLEYV